MPDQLVLGVRVHMVLVAEEAAAMLLDPARVAVLLPQLGGLLLPSSRRCAPSLQLGVLIPTVPLRRHRHDTGVDDLPATRHVALGRKMLVKAVTASRSARPWPASCWSKRSNSFSISPALASFSR